ncbi:MAG: RnfH family protein [Granulosicoccus sp.]
MNVEIVLAYPDKQYLEKLSLDPDMTLRDAAVYAFDSGLIPNPNGELDPMSVPLGIYGELEGDDYVLREGERIEIYRPLLQDPKEWRRARAKAAKQASGR